MLADGWQRAIHQPALAEILPRMTIYHGDAKRYLSQLTAEQRILMWCI
jgi:hypothetical protein